MIWNKIKDLKRFFPYFSGDSVIPLKIYFFSLPAIIFFTVTVEADLKDLENVTQWTLATIYSILVTAVFVFFCKYVVFAYSKQIMIPLSQVFVYTILLGAFKGISTYYFSYLLKLHDHSLMSIHILYRLIPAIIVALFFVPIASWIHYSLERYKKLRDELMTQAAKLQLENQSYKKLIEESKLTLKKKMDEIFKDIRQELVKIDNKENFEEEWPKISQLVREAALLEIRPESHHLWENQNKTFRDFKFRNFLISALKLEPFPWKLVIPIYFTTSYFQLFIYKPEAVNLITVIGIVIVFTFFNIGNYLHKNITQNKIQNYLLIVVMISVAMYLNFKLVSNFYQISFNLSILLLGLVWLFLVSIICSLLTTVNRTRDEILKEIEVTLSQQQVQKSTLATIENRINAKLAKFLHGYVQARLMSNALQLEIAVKNNDSDLAVREINRLTKDMVDEYGVMDQFNTESTFSEELEKIQQSWSGICEIEISGFRHLKIDQLIIKDFIEDAISEAIANSVRHGLADKINIQFTKYETGGFEIQVIDNGVGPIESGPGLGSEIFNLLSKDKWRLLPNPNGRGSVLILPITSVYDLQSSDKVGN